MADSSDSLPSGFTLLQVIPDLDTGGAEQTTVDMSAAVVAAGGRSLVATRGGRMTAAIEAHGGRVIYMPAQSKNPLVQGMNADRLAALIRREKVSILHVRSRAPAFAALWAAKVTRTPLVATYHGVYNASSSVKRWYNSVMTRGAAVIANSEYTRAHVLAEHGVDPAKVIAIPRGVDIGRFDPDMVSAGRIEALKRAWNLDPTDVRPKFLLAGRLTRWKGKALIIDAVARLKAKGGDALVLMAGDDQGRTGYRAELEQAIVAAGLKESIHLVGHCSEMPAAYLIADYALAPSLDPEAFGRTAVEPQAMGRPPLAADHGAARETVANGETGWLIAPGDADAWADAMATAARLPKAARARMGSAAMARARSLYSVETMCRATLAVYRQVLAPAS
jgi:glycosyltransferase involved in cell wall biosynthesis